MTSVSPSSSKLSLSLSLSKAVCRLCSSPPPPLCGNAKMGERQYRGALPLRFLLAFWHTLFLELSEFPVSSESADREKRWKKVKSPMRKRPRSPFFSFCPYGFSFLGFSPWLPIVVYSMSGGIWHCCGLLVLLVKLQILY